MPVLPPSVASTIESRVVGIRVMLQPLIYMEAANDDRSEITPPPKAMKRVSLPSLFRYASLIMVEMLSQFLPLSPLGRTTFGSGRGLTILAVTSSTIQRTLEPNSPTFCERAE